MSITDAQTSVTTQVVVDAPVAHCFATFTTGIGTWWDADKHILEAEIAEMVFEPRVGGHIIDRGVDGSEVAWATVIEYDPPAKLAFTWDLSTSWTLERDRSRVSEVHVSFTEQSPERTLVVLEHRHLDRHGEGWEGIRTAVQGGWSVLERFAAQAARVA